MKNILKRIQSEPCPSSSSLSLSPSLTPIRSQEIEKTTEREKKSSFVTPIQPSRTLFLTAGANGMDWGNTSPTSQDILEKFQIRFRERNPIAIDDKNKEEEEEEEEELKHLSLENPSRNNTNGKIQISRSKSWHGDTIKRSNSILFDITTSVTISPPEIFHSTSSLSCPTSTVPMIMTTCPVCRANLSSVCICDFNCSLLASKTEILDDENSQTTQNTEEEISFSFQPESDPIPTPHSRHSSLWSNNTSVASYSQSDLSFESLDNSQGHTRVTFSPQTVVFPPRPRKRSTSGSECSESLEFYENNIRTRDRARAYPSDNPPPFLDRRSPRHLLGSIASSIKKRPSSCGIFSDFDEGEEIFHSSSYSDCDSLSIPSRPSSALDYTQMERERERDLERENDRKNHSSSALGSLSGSPQIHLENLILSSHHAALSPAHISTHTEISQARQRRKTLTPSFGELVPPDPVSFQSHLDSMDVPISTFSFEACQTSSSCVLPPPPFQSSISCPLLSHLPMRNKTAEHFTFIPKNRRGRSASYTSEVESHLPQYALSLPEDEAFETPISISPSPPTSYQPFHFTLTPHPTPHMTRNLFGNR